MPIFKRSSQKVVYDFVTTFGSRILIGTLKTNGAKAIAIRWS